MLLCLFGALVSQIDVANAAFLTRSSSPSPSTFVRFSLRTATTQHRMFRETNEDDSMTENEEEDDDFPSWVQGLGQWPMRPDTSKSSTSSASSNINPLASLLDMEEIMLLVSKEENKEGILSSIGVTLDPIFSFDSILRVGESVLNITKFNDVGAFGNWISRLQKKISNITGDSAESILRQASAQVESLVAEASAVFSPMSIQDLIRTASRLLSTTTNTTNLVEAAKEIAAEQGLNVSEAASRAQDAIDFSVELISVAEGVMQQGYVANDTAVAIVVEEPVVAPSSRALFADFGSAMEIHEFSQPLAKAAEMGGLAGAVYERTIPRAHALGHSIVARGITEDVRWLITDSIATENAFSDDANVVEPFLVRTITIRGYDVSDEQVDRERLLNNVCAASPEEMKGVKGIKFHSGALRIARALYGDLKLYLMNTAPSHKVVLNGHSVGGSMCLLILLLMTLELGAEAVQDRLLRVYTFGSPPVVRVEADLSEDKKWANKLASMRKSNVHHCEVLELFGLPSTIVEGFVQPWDPVVRLFTTIDPLYPIVGDLGADGVTVYAGGPPRTLRPLTKAIFEAWEGWPRFRDTYRGTASQKYQPVGVQHILVPEPTRYLADRFVGVNIPVPPVETILRISSRELLPALNLAFPLDAFEISFVPQAIRSFVHHFYPAYGFTLVDYVQLLRERSSKKLKGSSQPPTEELLSVDQGGDRSGLALGGVNGDDKGVPDPILDWNRASQWFQRKE